MKSTVQVKGIDALKKQLDTIPFAAIRALTACAKNAQKDVRDHMADTFQLRNKFTQNQVRISSATKRDPVAAVFITQKAGYMVLHETGGRKEPKNSRHLAIPADAIWPNRTRVLSLGKRPRALAKKPGKRKPFLMQTESGARLIVRRQGKARLPVEILYNISISANVRKSLRMIETVARATNRDFNMEYIRAWDMAYRKAKGMAVA